MPEVRSITSPLLDSPPSDVRRYGNYYLVRKLAEGGMAEIFLAKQVGAEGFERNVVIKRMLPHLSSIPDFVNMFLDEARLAARLAHHNIVQINDLGLADGCYFICMEYLPGEDFSTLVRTSGTQGAYLPLPIVARVIADAARGLHFAHEFSDEAGQPVNIVHRDVSPSNIYVTYQGQVKMLDFGIARAESRVTRTTAGVVKGKYMYMSPEQGRGEIVDRRSDVFSLGVSLFEACTHVRPFAKDNDLAILNAVLKADFLPPRSYRADLSPELERIILKAMAASREDRFQTAGEMAFALEAFITQSPDSGSVAQLPALMRTLFGDNRYVAKTRIPTLASLAEAGVPVPGYIPPRETYAPSTPARQELVSSGVTKSVAVQLKDGKAISLGAPAEPAAPSAPAASLASRARWALIAAGLVLLVGLGVVAGRWKRESPSAEAPPVEPAPQVVAPVVPAPSLTPVPTLEPVIEKPAVEPNKPTRLPKRVQLQAQDVERVVGRSRASIMRCFELHKADLTKDQGVTQIRFTILGNGEVARPSVAGDLEGTKVARCLEGRVGSLHFPPHVDKELTLSLPLKYQVAR
jgi:serine/threonine protein kinase